MNLSAVIRKGRHYPQQYFKLLWRSLANPFFSKLTIYASVTSDEGVAAIEVKDQIPPQINKLCGWCFLHPRIWSERLGFFSQNGHIYFVRYSERFGKYKSSPFAAFPGSSVKVTIPAPKWIPKFILRPYFGGKQPAPVDVKCIIRVDLS